MRAVGRALVDELSSRAMDRFDATIECISEGYAVWFVPIVTARVR